MVMMPTARAHNPNIVFVMVSEYDEGEEVALLDIGPLKTVPFKGENGRGVMKVTRLKQLYFRRGIELDGVHCDMRVPAYKFIRRHPTRVFVGAIIKAVVGGSQAHATDDTPSG